MVSVSYPYDSTMLPLLGHDLLFIAEIRTHYGCNMASTLKKPDPDNLNYLPLSYPHFNQASRTK